MSVIIRSSLHLHVIGQPFIALHDTTFHITLSMHVWGLAPLSERFAAAVAGRAVLALLSPSAAASDPLLCPASLSSFTVVVPWVVLFAIPLRFDRHLTRVKGITYALAGCASGIAVAAAVIV